MPSHSTLFASSHRTLIHLLAAGFCAFAAWAVFADIDIVASAQGKLAPVSAVRQIQAPEDGRVRKVTAKDGQVVVAGMAVVELDPLYAQEDARSAIDQVTRKRLALTRVDAELSGQAFTPSDAPQEVLAAVLAEYANRRQAQTALVAEAMAAEARATSERSTVMERLRQAEEILPLVSRQAKQQTELREQGFVSDAAATDKTKELVAAQQEVAAQRSALRAAEAAISQARSTITRVQADYRRQLSIERATLASELAALDADSNKRGHRLSQMQLTAPVDGTVNGLAGLVPGQVVKAGQALLTVVPSGEKMRFEGWLRNEDAAYAAPGMPVKVKLAPYPFQKYGWMEGEVAWLGVDAETPESMRNAQGEPLFYHVRVDLSAQELVRDGQAYAVKPGMQAMADIQIGTRTLLEYLTSPMRKTLLEAAREK